MTGIRTALIAALLASTSPILLAQDKLDRELDFVRALAEKMRFIELAKGEADRLAGENRGAADQDRIAQLAVQVSFHGAKAKADRNVQRQLYKEALEKSKELIERSSDEKVLAKARATLADAAQEFGNFLIEELEIAREQAPDKVKELEDEAAATFSVGKDACTKVMESLEPMRKSNEEKNIEYGLYWMRKGVLMREHARAVKADRDVLIERAVGELSEMVLDFGEETALGLRGLFEIAQCKEVGGVIDEAVDGYRTTIKQIATSLKEADQIGMSGDVQGLLFQMMQEVYVRLGETLLRTGDPTTGELFAEFRANMTELGEKAVDLFEVVDPIWGHQMLLAEARFNAESGDAQKVASAIEMVQKINEKHPADYTGIKAKAALRDILSVNQNLMSAKLLFEIAKGEFQNKSYEEAIKGLRRAIAKMTPAEGKDLGLQSWHMLGLSYALTDRYLEATIALTEGLRGYGNSNKDEAAEPADKLDAAVSALKRQTKGDPALKSVIDAANDQILAFNVAGAGKIKYKEANDAFTAKDYAKAIAAYREVPNDFVFFETAQVRVAKACVLLGDFAAARQALAAYKDYREKTKLNSRTQQGQEQARAVAVVEAEFLEAQMAYFEARGNTELKIEKNPTKYQDAISRLRTYVANHQKDDTNNIPGAIEMAGRLHSDIGELDRAEECYAQLKPVDGARAARLATEIFVEYQNQAKTLDQELTDAIAQNKGDAAIDAARTSLEKVRRKIGALGLDYVANSDKPQLAVLVNTAIAFEDLKEWARVEELAQKTLTLYGGETNDKVKQVIDLTVRPMVGTALLNQRKFNDAYKMLTEAEKANPLQWELKRQIALCLGGWFEIGRTGAPVREPGLGRPADAYLKYWQEYKQWGLRDEVKQYSLEWYRFHWECYWFCKQAADKDSEYKARAETFYRKAKATDDFATLKNYGEKGLELLKYFQLNR